MVVPKEDGIKPSFLSSPATYWVTLIRLFLILLPELLNHYDWNNGNKNPFILLRWLQSPALLSVLVRPHETLSHLKEAQAIRALSTGKSMGDIYIANNSIRIPPLIFAAWSQLSRSSFLSSELTIGVFLLLIDLGIGYMLEQIGYRLLVSLDNKHNDKEERLQRILPKVIRPPYAHIFPIHRPQESKLHPEQDPEPSPIIPMTRLPLLAAQLYYWSPFTIFPSGLHQCWQNVTTFVLVASIYESSRSGGSIGISSFYLAFAAYMEPYHTIYIIPCTMLRCQKYDNGSLFKVTISMFVAMFVLWSIGLHGLSYTLVTRVDSTSNFQFYRNAVLGSMYGNAWFATSPNMSMQWYFHMQLFKRFRAYFGAIFTGIPFVLVGPLAIRFGNYPEVLVRSCYPLEGFFESVWVGSIAHCSLTCYLSLSSILLYFAFGRLPPFP
jgi:hypothetical protein